MRPFAGPGILTASGAGSFSGPDTLRAAGDTVSAPVVESPLPGGAADVVRFFLQTVPQWAQIAGAVVGVGVAITVVVLLWRRRAGIREWFRTRGRRLKLALAGSAAVVVLGAAALGGASWNYMQHDNGFCTGCHVMGPAYQRFVESEHDTLSCHDCHRQSIFASVRQLYFWVAERPAEIGPHSPVSTAVCSQCHVTGRPQMWQRIAETAGHRTHLESDSSALKNVQCVTCHGLEVHRFVPVDSTCGQANCHVNQAIGMGKMAQQTSLHCVTCHQFTAEVPKLATRDSASGTLVPGTTQCFSCHEMKQVLVEFDPARDPHAGTCGMCHNPHRQQSVAEAKQSCATAGCHADWRNIPFHSGLRHRNVGRECTLCHQQHAARVDPSDCAGCHQAVRERARGRVKPPLPFDTTRAIGEVSRAPDAEPARPKGKGDAPPHPDPRPTSPVLPPHTAPDSFPHDRHRTLACITCHVSTTGHGRLAFEVPRGCQLCHHQAPAQSDCAACHDDGPPAAPRAVTMRMEVSGHAARDRSVSFRHAPHEALRCVDCHTTPATLAPTAAAATCQACHDDHHAVGRACGVCHGGADPRAVHATLADMHVACDNCHAESTVARLFPDRAFCRTCHAEQQEHYPVQECTVCHFLASPDEFRPYLRRAQGEGDG